MFNPNIMRKIRPGAVLGVLLAAALLAVGAHPAVARTNIDVSVQLGGAPYHPYLRAYRAPEMVLVSGTDVYYAPDFRDGELYVVGSDWFLCQNNDWYHAQDYRGPWRSVSRIPRDVYYVYSGGERYSNPGSYSNPGYYNPGYRGNGDYRPQRGDRDDERWENRDRRDHDRGDRGEERHEQRQPQRRDRDRDRDRDHDPDGN